MFQFTHSITVLKHTKDNKEFWKKTRKDYKSLGEITIHINLAEILMSGFNLTKTNNSFSTYVSHTPHLNEQDLYSEALDLLDLRICNSLN